jgi:hypothetical protein
MWMRTLGKLSFIDTINSGKIVRDRSERRAVRGGKTTDKRGWNNQIKIRRIFL